MIKKLLIVLFVLPVFFPGKVNAEEFVITGNGNGSDSEVKVSVDQSTTVNQDNQANVDNNAEVKADTGANDVSDNTGGDSNITTGDITAKGTVNNDNVNFNKAGECPDGCPGPASFDVNIQGNGSESSNNVSIDSSNQIEINQNNDADITNDIYSDLNTGNNSATDNNGDVSIRTGDIDDELEVSNSRVNISKGIAGFLESLFSISIKGNGTESDNDAFLTIKNLITVNVNNSAQIVNNIDDKVNTGNNKANGNVGDVDIVTGDISKRITIKNEDINVSKVVICCEKEKVPEKEKPEEEKPPEVPPAAPPPGQVSAAAGAVSAAEAAGVGEQVPEVGPAEILPITGSYLLFILTILSAILFLGGLYLRLSTDVSPPRA